MLEFEIFATAYIIRGSLVAYQDMLTMSSQTISNSYIAVMQIKYKFNEFEIFLWEKRRFRLRWDPLPAPSISGLFLHRKTCYTAVIISNSSNLYKIYLKKYKKMLILSNVKIILWKMSNYWYFKINFTYFKSYINLKILFLQY